MISKKYNEQMGNYLAKLAQVQTNIRASAKQTNADRIRSMTDEELAKQLAVSGCPPCCFDKDGTLGACPAGRLPSRKDCADCWLDWLKQEATDV